MTEEKGLSHAGDPHGFFRLAREKLGYRFCDPDLLSHALTHSSYAFEQHLPKSSDNERLEFLGDAVLELATSRFLFTEYPDLPEGQLTKMRAALVCEEALYEDAGEVSLGDYILLGKGEESDGGRKRKSVVSDAFEAVIGAIYLDGGYEEAERFIRRFCLKDVERHVMFHDCKSALQEKTQEQYGSLPEYRMVNETGPDHRKEFTVEVWVQGELQGTGKGNSIKAAEKEAAYQALLHYVSEKH